MPSSTAASSVPRTRARILAKALSRLVEVSSKNGEKPQVRVLELGRPGFSPTGLPYALATADGQTWILELPPAIWFENIVRDLFNPMATRAP